MAWIFNPNDYEEKDFSPIPAGEHRVRIEDVEIGRASCRERVCLSV